MTTLPPAARGISVTALLVSHEGSRWLPAVLDGLAGQTRRRTTWSRSTPAAPTRVPGCSATRSRVPRCSTRRPRSSYGAAVAAGLGSLPAATGPDEWVWLLHDDSAPAPDALEQLLAVAESTPVRGHPRPQAPRVALAAPAARGRRHRSAAPAAARPASSGVSTTRASTTGSRDVLAVNTAGMLVRRSVLESLGFDRRLPLFGNDIDLGWRAARAGHRTVVVPEAVVFHVEAAHRGVRPHQIKPAGYRRGERAAALYTLLVNGSALGAAVHGGPAVPRQPAPRARPAAGPRSRRGARRAGRPGRDLPASLAGAGRPPRASARLDRPPARGPAPAGPAVDALPARPRLRQRRRLRGGAPGR